jgi:hypothetical protein
MGNALLARAERLGARRVYDPGMFDEPLLVFDHASAVCWGAILAGGVAAAALSLVLLILGAGLGLSSASLWAYDGTTAPALGVSTIAWITFTQLVASGMGGYLTGRLRSRWVAVRGDEVHFRDTAHGFLTWAIASLLTAGLLGSAIGSIAGGEAQLARSTSGNSMAAATGGFAAGSRTSGRPDDDSRIAYFTDALFRKGGGAGAAIAAPADSNSTAPAGAANPDNAVAATAYEVGQIFAISLQNSNLTADDARYVGQLVAQRTGLAPSDAETRVHNTYRRLQNSLRQANARANAEADQAYENSAAANLWIFIALLAGAGVGSLSATYGGRQRDN